MIYEKLEQRVNSPEFGSLGMTTAINDRELIIKAMHDGIIIETEEGLTYTQRPSRELRDALHRTLDTKAEVDILNGLTMAVDFMEIALRAVDDAFVHDHRGIVSMMTSIEGEINAAMHEIKYDMAERCGQFVGGRHRKHQDK